MTIRPLIVLIVSWKFDISLVTCSLSATCRTRRTFLQTWLTLVFPWHVVMATTSISGHRRAMSIAWASSTPASVSIIIFLLSCSAIMAVLSPPRNKATVYERRNGVFISPYEMGIGQDYDLWKAVTERWMTGVGARVGGWVGGGQYVRHYASIRQQDRPWTRARQRLGMKLIKIVLKETHKGKGKEKTYTCCDICGPTWLCNKTFGVCWNRVLKRPYYLPLPAPARTHPRGIDAVRKQPIG